MEIPFGSSSTANRALFSSSARFLKERRKKKRKKVGCFSQRRVLSRVACNGSNGKRTSDHWYSFNWMECVDFVARILLAGQKSVPLPSRPWEKCVRTCVFSPFFSPFFASVFSNRIETFDHDTMRVFFFFFLILNRVSERRSLRIMVDNEKRKNIAFQFPLFTLNIYKRGVDVRSYVTILILFYLIIEGENNISRNITDFTLYL